MNQINKPLRYGDAARAAGLKPVTLRNWFNRNDLLIFSQNVRSSNGKGWDEYTFADLAMFALMARLVRFGISVSHSNEIAFDALYKIVHLLSGYKNTPKQAFLASLKFKYIFVFGEDQNGFPRFEVETLTQLPMTNAIQKQTEILVVNVEKIVAEAFDRAGV